MSEKELRKAEVLARVQAGELQLGNAAELMRLSYRQGKRLWRRYRAEGAAGLQHRSAGQRSHRARPRKFREQVMRLVRRKYGGEAGERFGPTLAAEHLESDEGLKVDHETLRRWMLAEGLWSRERKRKPHRQRRQRKEHFGELVQLDGSFEQWLPGSVKKQCLMNMYLRESTAKERLRGEEPLTQFGRMCRKLGVQIIGASSPQAKGRVERSNGTQQDRLIKKLRLYGIGTMQAANRYLRQHYLPDHNRRFSREPISAEDYHRQRPSRAELDAIFRMEQERVIGNDWVVQYQGRLLQIGRESRYAPAGGKVMVSEGRDGGLQICYRNRPVKWCEIPVQPPRAESRPRAPGRALQVRRNAQQPAGTHPWKQWRPSWLQGQAAASAARSGP